MRQTNTDCYGCKYNYNWVCTKESVCTGPIPFVTYASTTSEPSYIPTSTSIMPDELVINGIKYRRVKDER